MRNTSNFIVESWDTQKPERGRIKKEVRVLSLMIRFGQECAMVFLKTQHGDTCTQSNQLKLIIRLCYTIIRRYLVLNR